MSGRQAQFGRGTLATLLQLEYGASLPEQRRAGRGFPVFGSAGEVGQHRDYLVPGPGIIVGRKGSVGETRWSDLSFWPIDTAYYVVPLNDTHLRYLFWLLSNTNLRRLDAATGVPGLNRNDVYELRTHIAPSDAQPRIAATLDLVEGAIRNIEAVIAKLTQVRAGLMQNLLTCGLNENGELRDSISHPEEFADSPLGRIPIGWTLRPLREVMTAIYDYRGRTPLKLGMEWGGGEIPALSANNVEMGRINFSKNTYYGSPALYRRWMTNGDAQPGDVVITTEAPLGNVAQIPDDRQYILSQRVVLLRPEQDILTSDYAALEMMGLRFQKELIRNSSGSTAVGIQRARLELIMLLVPENLDEQRCATEIVAEATTAIEEMERELWKLQSLKSGLASDLLCGHVSVPESVEVGAAS